ncbi:MAG: ABC transporter permease [Euryarchaeota archaeon]|nr:ABC transporter permease [Euryarchaeota archaeon]
MRGLKTIILKEIKELLTPATFLPIIVMALVFGAMGNMMEGIGEELEEKPVIGIINEDSGDLSQITLDVFNKHADIIYRGENLNNGLEKVKKEDGTALLVIPEGFSESIHANKKGNLEIYWVMKGAGLMDSISSEVVGGVIGHAEQEISRSLIKDGENPDVILNPTTRTQTTIFKDKEMKNISPITVSSVLSSRFSMVPIVIMMIIMMVGGTVISSMGMEKENKTLETLLTLPVRRSYIVLGKIVGCASVGLLMAIIYMVGLGYYMTSFGASSQIDLAKYGLTLGITDYFLIGVCVFFTLLAALSLSMILGTFAKNYKGAQMLNLPVVALAMVPMFVTMMKDFSTMPTVLKAVIFVIPFSHSMMAMRSLLFDNYALVLSGIAYVLVLSGVLIWVLVKIFSTEKVLTAELSLSKIKEKMFRR